ncbi:transcription factor TFIIIB component B'' homolog Bdp1 [Haematobia irritans]|uniref:transcription factor TFIIIB component B'' homolog Bdp1 n=1 Tax=Haematobia irritans TaxID=7368 RepID=UPI003F506265
MAMRRPRIKAQANIQLNSKRKSKLAEAKPKIGESIKDDPSGESKLDLEKESAGKEDTKDISSSCDRIEESANTFSEKEVISSSTYSTSDTNAEDNLCSSSNARCDIFNEKKGGANNNEESINSSSSGNSPTKKDEQCETAFKCPPKVEYQRSVNNEQNAGTDDVFYSDIEENALHLDLQKSQNEIPSSPSKNAHARQRIKATPVFGQRRNSFLGSSPSPHTSDDHNDFAVPVQRRERHISSSFSTNSNSSSLSHHTPHKYLPNGVVNGGMGRVRTESGCSVFSDTMVNTHKPRKIDEHKQNLKRDFEARFVNGIPDKSLLKMSDLIFYNPATNPMEQKPNLNLKIENSGKSTNTSDMKPFKEKKEKDSAEGSMPVPQLKLNSNGELILDDTSLVIETTAEQEARKVLANSSLIYLDENTGMNGFYSRQKRTRDWPSSETIKFYRCLQTVGTDFSLMVPLFPNRTRRDLKLKFKKEERINGHLINKALLYPKKFNIEELKKQIEEEDKRLEEEAEKYKRIKEAASKEVKKRKYVRSHADAALKGANIYQNETENEQKQKKPRKTQSKHIEHIVPAATTIQSQIDEINNNTNSSAEVSEINSNSKIKSVNDKVKRRRRRVPNIKKEANTVTHKTETMGNQPSQSVLQSDVTSPAPPSPAPAFLSQSIKVEQVKNEPQQMPLFTTKMEVNRDNDDVEREESGNHYVLSDIMEDNSSSMPLQENSFPLQSISSEQITESSSTDSSSSYANGNSYHNNSPDVELYSESRTFVNLDDGSLTTINNRQQSMSQTTYKEQSIITQPTPSPSPPSLPMPSPTLVSPQQIYPAEIQQEPQSIVQPQSIVPPPDLTCGDTTSSIMSERELNEQDIQQILTELAEGSLVLVSTLDPDDPDKVLNEIFMVDKNTGDLCDEPLNIPENIVQCILSVMS